jgi:hypothetical protein
VSRKGKQEAMLYKVWEVLLLEKYREATRQWWDYL